MNPGDFDDLKNLFFQKYSRDYDRFLDESRAAWVAKLERHARKDAPGGDDNEKPARLRLLLEIQRSNELYCRRDTNTPEPVIQDQLKKIEQLKELRVKAGKPRDHFAVLIEEGLALLHDTQLHESLSCFERALGLLEEELASGARVAIRDIVVTSVDYCYCLSALNRHDEAIQVAAKSMALAESVTDQEWKEMVEYDSSSPECATKHCSIYAYLASTDTHIQHSDWFKDSLHRRKFRGYWSDAVAFQGVPTSLSPSMKIALLSDEKWVACVPAYTLDIAKALYHELGDNRVANVFRIVRTKLAGFHLNFPDLGKAAAIAFVCFLACNSPKESVRDIVQQPSSPEWVDAGQWKEFCDEASTVLDTELDQTVETVFERHLSSKIAVTPGSPLLAFACADKGTRDI